MIWIILSLFLIITQVAFVLVNEYCRPQKAVAWLIILYIFPLIGFVLYCFVAKEYSCLYPLRKQDDSTLDLLRDNVVKRCKQLLPIELTEPPVDDNLKVLLKNGHSLPITGCNETTVYAEGEKAFEAMFDSISSAQHHIHVEFYIVRDDLLGTRLQQLLIQKAQEGVEVRILYDGIGSYRLGRTYIRQLQAAGVETGCYSPLLSFLNKRINFRNHRKIVLVDGKIGYIGGLNIGDEYLGNNAKIGYWRDTHFKIEGDAVLWIQYTFATDWYFLKRHLLCDPIFYPVQESQGNELIQIVKSGPDETILGLIFTLIISAKKRVYIETPYFIPDSSVLLALKTAAIRGVDVRIVIPAVPDSMLVYYASLSYVRELMQTGIRFFSYQTGFIHAKVIISDEVACSGSANLDMRSFTGQFEIDAIFLDGKTVDRLIKDFNRDLVECEEILPEKFKEASGFQKMKEIIARLLSPLF